MNNAFFCCVFQGVNNEEEKQAGFWRAGENRHKNGAQIRVKIQGRRYLGY